MTKCQIPNAFTPQVKIPRGWRPDKTGATFFCQMQKQDTTQFEAEAEYHAVVAISKKPKCFLSPESTRRVSVICCVCVCIIT
jgi:hypothetical protein